MKTRPGFFLLMLIMFIVLTSCVKPDPASNSKSLENLPTSVSVIPGVEKQSPQKVFTTYVAIISGTEVISGFRTLEGTNYLFTSKGVCWSTSKNPTITDSKIEGESSLSIFHCHITGLELNTTYYLRAFAIYSGRIAYSDLNSFTTPATKDLVIFNPNLNYGSVSDIDGNIYKTIQIGTQTWMAENLKTTRYNDGSQIYNVINNSEWGSLKTGAYRWWENDEETFKNLYGALYNWSAVNTQKLCPVGWHVPSDNEWEKLEMALGMTQAQIDYCEFPGLDSRGTDQGIQMKATSGWSNWEWAYGNGTNKIGFSALPAGATDGGPFEGVGFYACWWTSMGEGSARIIDCMSPGVFSGVYCGPSGFSVRCLKD
jgi:uncharacterized protein (TIGR02145 family)